MLPKAVFQPPETLCPQRNQLPYKPLAVLVEIDQGEGGKQPFVILLQAAITNLGVLEDPLQDAKRPLHLRPKEPLIKSSVRTIYASNGM